MKTIGKRMGLLALMALFIFGMLPSTTAAAEGENTVNLHLMETTDIHGNIMNYDYFEGSEDESIGLVNVATLVKNARENNKNTMLFDNGDLIQGSPMADYAVNENILDEKGSIHPAYKVMNMMEYDVGNYGNHEFNYGLDYLEQAVSGSDFPYVNANIYKDTGNGEYEENYFNPYKILDKKVTDENGNTHTIKVGVIGFAPPQIMTWDNKHLEGNVITRDLKATAQEFVPKMKEEGADIIVGIPHSSLGSVDQYTKGAENATYELSKVDGIDALMFGHSHKVFPGEDYAELDGKHNIDLDKGTINGVQTVQAGFGGSHLGVIDLQLEKTSDGWDIVSGQSKANPIYDSETGEQNVEADEEAVEAVSDDHKGTMEYVSTPVGETEVPLFSYFAQVMDDPTVQIVSDAQMSYGKDYIKGTEYEDLPVLSAAAPFKAGRDGPGDYTDISAGGLAIKDTTSLYKYPNTVQMAKLTGKQVIDWMEWNAGQFNQIDPDKSEPQELVDTDFRSYNFDIMDGLTYEIDVTEPRKYNDDEEQINEGNRIKNVKYNGKPIDMDQEFLVVTNNHRAASKFANPDGDNIVIEAPDETRQVLIDYISEQDSINPQADNNWSFAHIDGSPTLEFRSAPGGKKYAEDMEEIEFLQKRNDGYADYEFHIQENKEPVQTFPDVPQGYWAKDAIEHLVSEDVLKGYETGKFEPENNITRVNFTRMLVRTLGLEGESDHSFDDVYEKDSEVIGLAHNHGLINGYSEHTFKPYKQIRREEMAAMIVRAHNIKNDTDYEADSDYQFADEGNINPTFKDKINAARELELMVGKADNTFKPDQNAHRSEAAKVVYRLSAAEK